MVEHSVTVNERTDDWYSIDWKQVNRKVTSLRQRIFKASEQGDWKRVRSLQRLMLRSESNRLLSVRRVTQVNQGKHTPGVDKVVVKTSGERNLLLKELREYTPWKAQPVKRVYIPKVSGKIRGLGIPTITDRCMQAVVKNALEPLWESQFEGSSYGFRPGRGCHDALEKIFGLTRPRGRKRWILDADIKGAFDHISHSHLLETIGAFPARELIKQWVKAGVPEAGKLHQTEEGSPQGKPESIY